MADPLRFLFDFVSPYAYLGWTQIHRLAERHGREVAPVPVLFAGLLNAHGHKGPAEIPPKRLYVFKDAYRKAHRLGLPELRPPPSHPFNPLVPLRVSGLAMTPEARRRLIDALFHTAWALGAAIDSPQAVATVASSVGLDGEALVREAGTPAAKDRLRASTETALREGAFGVPTVLADGEPFWGVDALESLDDFLAGRDPFPADAAARWADLPSSATR